MSSKKKGILIAILSIIVICCIGAAIYFTSSNKLQDDKKEDTDAFGYQALKINGEYVSTDIFIEERISFFKNGAEMQKCFIKPMKKEMTCFLMK
jgi:foldase protein PrsA